jgi:hypothetical protein
MKNLTPAERATLLSLIDAALAAYAKGDPARRQLLKLRRLINRSIS